MRMKLDAARFATGLVKSLAVLQFKKFAEKESDNAEV